MNKFEIFLEQAQLNTPPLNRAKLNFVKVIKKNQVWLFDISFEEVISPNQMSLFIDQLQTFFTIPNVVSKVDYQFHFLTFDLSQHYQGYYDMIVHKASEAFGPLSVFKNYAIEFHDHTYSVIVEKDATSFSRYFPELKSWFKKHGLIVNFEIKVSEALTPVSEVVTQKQIEQTESLMKISKEQDNVILAKKQNFKKGSDPNAVAIKEIPATPYELDKYKNEKGDTNFLIEGEVFKSELRRFKTSNLLIFSIFDDEDAITVKRFVKSEKDIALAEELKPGDIVSVSGFAEYDTFQKEVVLRATAFYHIERPEKKERMDKAKEKRIEFHIHTKASPMDAVTSIETYVETLEKWGHEAFAITDHNGLYAYPDLYKSLKGKKIKPIYGVEVDYVNDEAFKIASDYHTDFPLRDATYVVFDIETTGLSNQRDKIIEIAAYKIKGGVIGERFEILIDPEEPLSEFTKSLTNITDDMLVGQPKIEEALPKFLDFIKDAVLVAHNASFDVGFIIEKAKQLGLEVPDNPVIDTLSLARYYYHKELKRFNLKAVTKLFKVNLDAHHRAISDAYATAEVFLIMLQNLYKEEIMTYYEINASLDEDEVWKHPLTYYATILAQNQVGYKNLFKIISDALTTHYYDGARTLKSVIRKYRQGILVGSNSEFGEVFETALNRNEDDLREVMEFYDYIEVHPPKAYQHLEKDLGEFGREILQATVQKIIRIGKEMGKLVIATSNAHYLHPEEKKYREIYIHTKSVGGGLHPLANYDISPDQHVLTTQEMIDAFSYLDASTVREIVIDNPKELNKRIELVQAFPKELYSIPNDAFKDTLGIPSIADHMKDMVYKKAHELYGEKLHFIVQERIDKELHSIIDNEFAPIYFISHLLVKKSLEDGYLVGSRGSVGSSLVATLLDITEVNPLRPHYRCPNGDYAVFKMTDEEIFEHGIKQDDEPFIELLKHVKSGYDLPNRTCPHCGAPLYKDGHDIPFETFLGFDGDKVPDIDLNFSGDYQATAHAYVRELLGEDYTFRAGTIQTVAERNAYGYVKGYLEDRGIQARSAMIERLAKGIEGVKRSTGQHPGGIVVVPKTKDIYDVTPVQYPADDTSASWKTTHFDYHSFEANLLKLDILGHDDPTMIKFLMDYVAKHPDEFPFKKAQDIPLDDPKVYQLFQGTDVLGFKPDEVYGTVASYAIPEFGTPFTRQMLVDTKPNSFAGLVKISGLSHGTDVWLKNSQDLVLGTTPYGKIDFNDIIGCRDDIMVELAERGLPPLKAFEIMEFVRKGKPSQNKTQWAEYEALMKSHHIPDWYIWSASQIKYMFPKAHATAYVIMAMRIAWFKVYKPLLFYSGFFSKRAVQFDHDTMVAGYNAIRNKLIQLNQSNDLKAKDEDLITTLNVALEMTKRGFKFYPVDIEKSEATTFVMEKDGLRMPFSSIDGLGEQVALDIVSNRKERPFVSKEDVSRRTKINKTVFEKLQNIGAFDNLSEASGVEDIGLFDAMFQK